MTLTDRIQVHVSADDADSMLSWYLDRNMFSGAWFETLGGPGDDPAVANRFTPADLVAVSTLSARVPGWAAICLLETRAAELNALLEAIPANRALHEATDDDLEAVYAAQHVLDSIYGIGHVTRSKLLARKRPHLVPIRDQHVLLALADRDHGPFTQPLRDALASGEELIARLQELRQERMHLSLLRVLDIIVWMRAHGAASVT